MLLSDTIADLAERGDYDADTTAFSAGCDARLRGEPITANPYPVHFGKTEWARGWRHCNSEWSLDVYDRWPVRRLPEIVREAAE